jgi:hypothetical protein
MNLDRCADHVTGYGIEGSVNKHEGWLRANRTPFENG